MGKTKRAQFDRRRAEQRPARGRYRPYKSRPQDMTLSPRSH